MHLWQATLDISPSRIQVLREILSPDEQERAARFYFPRDRNHFIAARGRLREILARYLAVNPALLQFRYGVGGKPMLAGDPGAALCFNLSHSAGLALYAITRGRQIGVDLELLRPSILNEQIPEQFFSQREVTALRALPENLQLEAFFACWTRKEAYLKARGDGFGFPLDRFDVSLTPGITAVPLSTPASPHEAARWSLRSLKPCSGYIGALAVEGRNQRIEYWQWRD